MPTFSLSKDGAIFKIFWHFLTTSNYLKLYFFYADTIFVIILIDVLNLNSRSERFNTVLKYRFDYLIHPAFPISQPQQWSRCRPY